MLKKIVTVFLFAALIAVALLQYFYIKDSSGKFTNMGKQAISLALADDINGAMAVIYDLDKQWSQKKDSFEALMEHNETDKISMSMERALSFAQQKDKIEFLAEMSVLVFLLDHIHEIDAFAWENIL